MTEFEKLMQNAPNEAGKRELYERLAGRSAFLFGQISKMEREMTGKKVLSRYDNGGGQSGERVNPLMRVYLSAVKEYRACVRDLAEMVVEPYEEKDEFDNF